MASFTDENLLTDELLGIQSDPVIRGCMSLTDDNLRPQ